MRIFHYLLQGQRFAPNLLEFNVKPLELPTKAHAGENLTAYLINCDLGLGLG